MPIPLYQALHRYDRGFMLSRLLRNRGRSRHLVSYAITQDMQRQLASLRSGDWQLPTSGNQHLPAISLTSWQPRFSSLPLVLLNLLKQDLLPSRIVVWLTSQDYNSFDATLRQIFERSIVEFRKTQNFGPHKKWLPLAKESNSPFVICDDDIFYANDWYRTLVDSDTHQSCIAHRCHRVNLAEDREVLPYKSWEKDITTASTPSHDLFAVGCGGVLIYPERIASRFRDWDTISAVCPKADDVWLKLAHLDSGTPVEKTKHMSPCIEYLDSQSVGLIQTNVNLNGNDVQIKDSLENLQLNLRWLAV